MSDRRPTQQDVARAAGVHRATVSLVLKNHPSIPECTRAKVHQVARELGYVPDPMLSALAAYRSRTTPRAFQGTLAWINHSPARPGGKAGLSRLYEGAARRAEAMGYRLEEFSPGIHYTAPRDLRRVLLARGIRGILLRCEPEGRFDFDYSGFSAIAVGPSLGSCELHTVTNSQTAAIGMALETLKKRGFNRIGVLLPPQNSRRPRAFQALSEDKLQAAGEGEVAVLDYRKESREDWFAWYSKHLPEAVIAADVELTGPFEETGLQVPESLSVAVIGISQKTPFWAGIDPNSEEMGRVAVDSVVGMIHNNETGIPGIRRRILVEGRWKNGLSVMPGSPARFKPAPSRLPRLGSVNPSAQVA